MKDLELHQKYLNNIVSPVNIRGGICRINEYNKGILIEGATKVEFSSLYANLLVRLYRDGVLKSLNVSVDSQIIEKVEYFLKNRHIIKSNLDEYTKYKTWINSLYNKELRGNVYQLFDVYYQYMSQYYVIYRI